MELRHQEECKDARLGQAYYLHSPVDKLRVVELNTGVNLTHEGRYYVEVWRRDGWTRVISDVESESPQGAALIALDVISNS